MSDTIGRIESTTATNTNSTSSTTNTSNDILGKDAFLKLLVAQMQYQDPLAPTDNTQSIAQLAQFSALEQMTNVASTLEKLNNNMVYFTQQSSLLQGAAMIGKYVTGYDAEGETLLSGKVEAVQWLNGDPKLLVRLDDGTLAEVEMYFVTHVQDHAPEKTSEAVDETTETSEIQAANDDSTAEAAAG